MRHAHARGAMLTRRAACRRGLLAPRELDECRRPLRAWKQISERPLRRANAALTNIVGNGVGDRRRRLGEGTRRNELRQALRAAAKSADRDGRRPTSEGQRRHRPRCGPRRPGHAAGHEQSRSASPEATVTRRLLSRRLAAALAAACTLRARSSARRRRQRNAAVASTAPERVEPLDRRSMPIARQPPNAATDLLAEPKRTEHRTRQPHLEDPTNTRTRPSPT
ncbi:hypothetical protein GPU89_39250 [Burkholderia cepacia]|nr:hypothetical protein [Burkholderia cepacia]